MKGKEKLKKIGVIFGLIIFGALLALVLVEGILAFISPVATDDWSQYDPVLGWRGKENFEGFSRGEEWSIKFKLNSEGFRFNIPENNKKEPGVYRIVVLGDSFTMAYQVPHNKTFCYLLERKLNSSEEFNNKKVEVLNFGINGYGTAQEYLTLKHYALKYKPDLVILLFYPGNDILDNYYKPEWYEEINQRPYFTLNEIGNLELVNISTNSPKHTGVIQQSIKLFFRDKFSNIYTFIQKIDFYNPTLHKLLYNAGFVENREVIKICSHKDWLNAWNITKKLITTINNKSKEDGAEFLLVIGTVKEQLNKEYRQRVMAMRSHLNYKWNLEIQQNKILKSFCTKNNITCLELLPSFRNYKNKTGDNFHYNYDSHWNKNGHELAAKLIYNEIMKN